MSDPSSPTITPQPVPSAAPPRGWTAGRIALVVIGSILGLLGLAALGAGATLAWASATQRDDGYFDTDTERFSSGAFAITSDDVDLGSDARPGGRGFEPGDLFRVRLRAEPADPGGSIFVGIARADDANAFLDGVAHDVIRDVDVDPFSVEYRSVDGDREPDPPQDQDIWVASVEGSDRQTLVWEPESGDWVVVVMNSDASRGVVADLDVGVEIRHLWAIVAAVLVVGALLLAAGVLLIVLAARRATHPPTPAAPVAFAAVGAAPPVGPAEAAAAPETARGAFAAGAVGVAPGVAVPPGGPTGRDPVGIVGRLDEPLSRWLWVVKWLLAIPHYIVLVFLWIAAIVLTIVAGVAILFTGRYPRGIFDFNVGVLRWTWRVIFYATGVIGTDRYPPFSLDARSDYPATLDIAYPDRLANGLVLVKWWLLAIPHYVIIGLIGTGWWWGLLDGGRGGWGVGDQWAGGLLGILVLVAGVRLLFTAHYPREMFELLMGLNRWVFRVAAYVLLMTDEYPPFRLDQGSTGRSPAGS